MENNIKVFGAPVTAEAPIHTEDVVKTAENVLDETSKADVNQETDQTKTEESTVKPVTETKPTAESTDNKPKNEEFKISFNEEVQKPAESQTAKQETMAVTDEMVSKFLKETYNIDVKNLAELSKKEELPEEVAKFKKFYEETGGKSHKDFQNAQKDWAKEPKDDTIKEFMKYENPNMSEQDIDDQIDLLRVTQDDEDELDQRELKRRKLDYNKEYSKALEFMNKKSEEFKSPERNQIQQKPPTAEEIAKAHEPYWKARNESLKNLNEIDISIEGIGDIKLNISQEHKDLISKNTETQDAFFSRWQDKDGAINTDKSSLDTGWSIPEVRREWIASMLEQANTLIMDKFSKANRNVKLDIIKPVSESEKVGGLTIIGNGDISKAGQPLI